MLATQAALRGVAGCCAARRLDAALRTAGARTEVLAGDAALEELAGSADVDVVMAAIVGAAGLPSTLAAASAGKQVLVANKESLVLAGALLVEAARRSGATLVPIDSEHNAIFQCLPATLRTGELPLGRATHPADGVGRPVPAPLARGHGST